SRTLLPLVSGRELVEVAACAVIKHDVAWVAGLPLTDIAQLPQEWELAFVLVENTFGLGHRDADHLGQFLNAGAVDVGKVDALGGLALEAGECGRELMEVRLRVDEITRHCLGGFTQLVLIGVVYNKAEFLLRDIGVSPDLVVLRQKDSAN